MITKNTKNYPGVEGDFYDYTGNVGPQDFRVWFKFGCAHITTIPPEGSGEEEDYIHICEPKEFAEFLLGAIELSEKEGNSFEQ